MIKMFDEDRDEICWTKSNVFQFLELEDQFRMHIMDLFHNWWEQNWWEQENTDKLTTEEPMSKIDSFVSGFQETNGEFENFVRYDWETQEWVITHYNKEHRFSKEWAFEKLDQEPDIKVPAALIHQ